VLPHPDGRFKRRTEHGLENATKNYGWSGGTSRIYVRRIYVRVFKSSYQLYLKRTLETDMKEH
jgi:hypothetical protein